MTTDFTKYGFIFDMDGTLVDNMHFHMQGLDGDAGRKWN